MALQVERSDPPMPVQLLTHVWLAGDEDRPLHWPGDRVVLPAEVARWLIDDGLARAIE